MPGVNILGQGVLDPDAEATLLAQGVVYATLRTMPNGHTYLSCSYRQRDTDIKNFVRSLQPSPRRRLAV